MGNSLGLLWIGNVQGGILNLGSTPKPISGRDILFDGLQTWLIEFSMVTAMSFGRRISSLVWRLHGRNAKMSRYLNFKPRL